MAEAGSPPRRQVLSTRFGMDVIVGSVLSGRWEAEATGVSEAPVQCLGCCGVPVAVTGSGRRVYCWEVPWGGSEVFRHSPDVEFDSWVCCYIRSVFNFYLCSSLTATPIALPRCMIGIEPERYVECFNVSMESASAGPCTGPGLPHKHPMSRFKIAPPNASDSHQRQRRPDM